MLSEQLTRIEKFLEDSRTAKARDAYPELEKTCSFAARLLEILSKESFDTLLDPEARAAIAELLKEFEDTTARFFAVRETEQCLRASQAIASCYDVLLSSVSDIEVEVASRISSILERVDVLDATSQARIDEVEQSLAGTRHAEEESKKTRSQLDKLLIEAKKRVNDFAEVEIRKAHKGMEGLRSKFDRELEDHRSTWEGRFGDLQQQREQFLEILDTTKRYYKESRFDEYSRQEQLEANRYRRIGMALMVLVALVVVMLTSFSIYGTYDASPGSIAERYLLVFSLMIPAIYATRESNRHRGNSDRYSQMACELTAFEVVLQDEDMPRSMKHEIKAEIIKRYFGAMTVFASKDMIDVLGVGPFSNSKKGQEGQEDKEKKKSVNESEGK